MRWVMSLAPQRLRISLQTLIRARWFSIGPERHLRTHGLVLWWYVMGAPAPGRPSRWAATARTAGPPPPAPPGAPPPHVATTRAATRRHHPGPDHGLR